MKEGPADPARLVRRLSDGFAATAATLVPWFLDNMPAGYFRDTPEPEREAHLRAIIAARASDQPIAMSAKSDDGRTWTFFRERDQPGLLGQLMRLMPSADRLRAAHVYSARDGALVLDVFHFGDAPRFDPTDADLAEKRAQVLEHAVTVGRGDAATLEALGAHFEACAHAYLRAVGIARIWEHFLTCQALAGGDGAKVSLRPTSDGDTPQLRLDLAAGHAVPPRLFERVCVHLGRWGLDIRRGHLDLFETPHGPVCILGFVLAEDLRLTESERERERLQGELQRLRHLDDAVIALAYAHPERLDLEAAEIAVALAHLASACLGRDDQHAFSRERLLELLDRHVAFTAQLAELFRARARGEDAAEPENALRTMARERGLDPRDRRALEQLVSQAVGTSRTNLQRRDRWSLALRLDPEVVTPPGRTPPFGVFFVHGRGFDAFHVRFRDIARGGMRVVAPRGPEQHATESRKMFDEAYDLAFAQQLKNKDIPEGGAKAVILVAPGQPIDRGARGFVDGILDLIVAETAGGPQRELIYLGPDENISPPLIEWTVRQAEVRGYPLPTAFMSSKPGAGINHKEYGVTSEGVVVFLEEALLHVGIDPRRDPFTVTLTGGPDGDVAGNAIRILFREYGARCRILGIADGSGAVEDPDGLAPDALLAMVAASSPIAAFPPDRLGPRGRLVRVDEPDGARMRDSLHNRVVADAFIPAGGRPGTIHEDNWQEYRVGDRPASRVIVEGANLFLTTAARAALWKELGVLVVKDSSANKCGVICSSFEIVACMLLGVEELIAHKERLVAEVLDRLRLLARREAQLLFAERTRHPQRSLPELSVELSRSIERVSDAAFAAYPDLVEAHPEVVERLVREHLPPVLVELAGARVSQLPPAYQAGIVAASLASRIVYREGLSFLADLPDDSLAALALRYLESETESLNLAAQVRQSDLPERERIAVLLELGGPRAGLRGRHAP